MHIKALVGLMAVAAFGLAACGSSGTYATPGAAAAAAVPASAAYSTISPPPRPAQASVTLEDTPLGTVLVDAEGRTLYAFTNDSAGASTCTGACAKAWPAAIVTVDSIAGPGVTAPLSVIDAPAGGKMLKAGKWPLYRFAGDTAVGDTNGQGSGGVWFAVKADGTLAKGSVAS